MPSQPTASRIGCANPSRTFTPPAVLTPRQFHAEINGVIGLNAIYEMVRAKRLRHVKIGSRYLILASETTEFFQREAGMGWAA
jgi:hypothetical protein